MQTSYSVEPSVAIEGMLSDASPKQVETRISTDAASIPFGRFVVADAGGDAGEKSAKMPSASSGQAFLGPVVSSMSYSPSWTDRDGNVHGDLDADGLVPGAILNVLVKGRIWVPCETGCAVGDPVFVRYTTDGGSPALIKKGAVGNASGTGRTLDLTGKARFLSALSAPAAGATQMAEIEVDMTA